MGVCERRLSLVLHVAAGAFRLGVTPQSTARWRILLVLAVLPAAVGCHVPQKPGLGKAIHRTEAVTKRPYWLYLPPRREDALDDPAPHRRTEAGPEVQNRREAACVIGFKQCQASSGLQLEGLLRGPSLRA